MHVGDGTSQPLLSPRLHTLSMEPIVPLVKCSVHVL
jgi:hypothetical protein